MAQMKRKSSKTAFIISFTEIIIYLTLEFPETPNRASAAMAGCAKATLKKHRPGLYELTHPFRESCRSTWRKSIPAALIGWTVWPDKWQMLKASAKR